MTEIFSTEDLARLHDVCNVVWGRDGELAQAEFDAAIGQAEVVITGDWRYGELDPSASPNLRAIISVSGAFPMNLDYDVCAQRNIRVLSVAPAFARQVAEMGLALALASARGVVAGDRAFRQGGEEYLHAANVDSFMLYGKPIGMIGYGGIARELTPLLAPFGGKISVFDPWLSDGYLRTQGVERVGLDEVLGSSRVIFVTAAPTTANEAMLSREKLSLIRSDAVLVLLSRAHVVDFDSLTELVAAGHFRAATDVVPTEPLAPDHSVREVDDIILSAHKAGSVAEGLWEIGQMVCNDLEAILAGMPPRQLQNAEPELIARYSSNIPPALDDTEESR